MHRDLSLKSSKPTLSNLHEKVTMMCSLFFVFIPFFFLHLDISKCYLWRWQCIWKLIKHIREQEVSKGTLQNVSHYFLLAGGTVVLQGQHHRVLR